MKRTAEQALRDDLASASAEADRLGKRIEGLNQVINRTQSHRANLSRQRDEAIDKCEQITQALKALGAKVDGDVPE